MRYNRDVRDVKSDMLMAVDSRSIPNTRTEITEIQTRRPGCQIGLVGGVREETIETPGTPNRVDWSLRGYTRSARELHSHLWRDKRNTQGIQADRLVCRDHRNARVIPNRIDWSLWRLILRYGVHVNCTRHDVYVILKEYTINKSRQSGNLNAQ